jgi:hypothetical protein
MTTVLFRLANARKLHDLVVDEVPQHDQRKPHQLQPHRSSLRPLPIVALLVLPDSQRDHDADQPYDDRPGHIADCSGQGVDVSGDGEAGDVECHH